MQRRWTTPGRTRHFSTSSHRVLDVVPGRLLVGRQRNDGNIPGSGVACKGLFLTVLGGSERGSLSGVMHSDSCQYSYYIAVLPDPVQPAPTVLNQGHTIGPSDLEKSQVSKVFRNECLLERRSHGFASYRRVGACILYHPSSHMSWSRRQNCCRTALVRTMDGW